MKHFIRTLFSMILSTFILTGCTQVSGMLGMNTSANQGREGPDWLTSQQDVAWIAGDTTDNVKMLDYSSPTVQDVIFNTTRYGGRFTIIQADQSPEVIYSEAYDTSDGSTETYLNTTANDNTQAIINYLSSELVPNDPEIDYYKCLKEAATALRAGSGYTNKTIILVGSLLSTEGILQMDEALLGASPELIVKALEERGELLDLSDISVRFMVVDPDGEQDPLSIAQTNNLKEIYKAIVEAGGGTAYFEDVMSKTSTRTDLPYVTPIEISGVDSISPEEVGVNSNFDTITITETEVSFIPNSSELLDEHAALESLTSVGEYLKNNPEVNIILVGNCAGEDNNQDSKDLSLKRSQKVSELLANLGVNSERITTVGLGCTGPFYTSGKFFGPEASINRIVTLVREDSPKAQEVLSYL